MKPILRTLAVCFTLAVCVSASRAQNAPSSDTSPESILNSMATLRSGAPAISSQQQTSASAQVPTNPAASASSADTASALDDDTNPDGSDVRIVRLSQTSGRVMMDRGNGKGFETAFPNLPITEGATLRTTSGVAEVEFEDDSTLRLTPNTSVEFSRLERGAGGNTATTITILSGTVYANLEKTKDVSFILASRQGSATLPPSSQVRFEVNSLRSELTVFKGDVPFTGNSAGSATVGKDKELFTGPQGQVTEEAVVKAQAGPYDDWNKGESEFHKQYAKGAALAGSPYSYGLVDLNYYGAFADLPGCGRAWRPYFVSAAWDPYANGLWAWYPDFGYTWVSVYPWGWAPFHYGAWEFCGAGGWGWVPGGAWAGLRFRGDGHGFGGGPWKPIHRGPIHHPFPPRPPRPIDGKTFLAVNTRPLTISGFNAATHSFVVRNDSAGLGVPHQMFSKLSKTSGNVEQHGFTSFAMTPFSNPGSGFTWHPANGSGVSGGRPLGGANSSGGHTSGGTSAFHSTGSSFSGGGTPHSSGGSAGSSASAGAHH